jgi:lipopolysaccharide assembly protein A
MKIIYLIFSFLLFILLLGLAIKNVEPVELHYYLGSIWRAPLSLMLLVSFFAGTMAGLLICISPLIKQRRRLMALERELKILQANIHPNPLP